MAFLTTTVAQASTDITDWITRFRSSMNSPFVGKNFIYRIALISNYDADARAELHKTTKLTTAVPALVASVNATRWAWKINHEPRRLAAKLPKSEGDDLLDELFYSGHADAVFIATADSWKLLKLKDHVAATIFEVSAPEISRSDAAGMIKWLTRRLGYQGVVLDQTADHVLVLGSSPLLAGKRGAVLIKESADKTVLYSQPKPAGGKLKFVARMGKYAIYEKEAVLKGLDIKVGTKVVRAHQP